MADDISLTERLSRAADVAAPAPRLHDVERRARILRWRRAGAATLVAAIAVVAMAVPLSRLGGLRGDGHRAGGNETRVGAIGFDPAEGWSMAASEPTSPEWAPTVWVTNGPFADSDAGTERNGVLRLAIGPEATRDGLPTDGILITAEILYASRNPLPPNETFPPTVLPLRLPATPPQTSWEGAPRDHSLHSFVGTIEGHWVSVTIEYGTPQPDQHMLADAQAELDRLFVEPAPTPVDDIDQFGISMAVPDGWDARLFAWTSGPPTLELSTLPLDGPSGDPAIPNRGRLGTQDTSIVLAENDAIDLGFPATTLPLSIRGSDRCDCEVLDDGSRPPDGHALYHRTFETGGRSFDLYVEFGSSPSPAAWDDANRALAAIEIAGQP